MVSHLRPKMKVKKEVVAKECIDVFSTPINPSFKSHENIFFLLL